MVIGKILEIRDEGTRIDVIAICPQDNMDDKINQHYFKKAGYSKSNRLTILYCLQTHGAHYDPYSWGVGRTMRVAHEYINQHYRKLAPGSVVDVEHILGLKTEPKRPERETPKNTWTQT